MKLTFCRGLISFISSNQINGESLISIFILFVIFFTFSITTGTSATLGVILYITWTTISHGFYKTYPYINLSRTKGIPKIRLPSAALSQILIYIKAFCLFSNFIFCEEVKFPKRTAIRPRNLMRIFLTEYKGKPIKDGVIISYFQFDHT